MAAVKHKFRKFIFNSANQKLVVFLDELQKLAKDGFGIATHAITEQFINATVQPHLKKSINPSHLENGTYEQIVTQLESELELKALEAPDQLQINTVSHTANANENRPKPTCHHCRRPRHYNTQCRLLKKQKEQSESTQNNPGNKSSGANRSIPSNSTNKNNNNYKNTERAERKPKTVHLPCEICGKIFNSTENCYYGADAANSPPPRHRKPERQSQVQERASQSDSNENTQATAQNLNWNSYACTPELRLTDRR